MPNLTTDSTTTIPITILITDTHGTDTTLRGDVMATYEHTGPLIAPPPAIALILGVIIRTCQDTGHVTPIRPKPLANHRAQGLITLEKPHHRLALRVG